MIIANKEPVMKKSFVQVYTGNGKGKTTAAVGLAVRAAGRGLSVKFVQFMKGRDTGEMFVFDKLPSVVFLRASESRKFYHQMSEAEKQVERDGVKLVLESIHTWLDDADILILDEAMAAMTCGLLLQEEVLRIIDSRGKTEVVLTGRDAPEAILARAHLVTEMKDIRHYMDAGVAARCGIEF
jgi:cob(I)alamin adenosyltransferase